MHRAEALIRSYDQELAKLHVPGELLSLKPDSEDAHLKRLAAKLGDDAVPILLELKVLAREYVVNLE